MKEAMESELLLLLERFGFGLSGSAFVQTKPVKP